MSERKTPLDVLTRLTRAESWDGKVEFIVVTSDGLRHLPLEELKQAFVHAPDCTHEDLQRLGRGLTKTLVEQIDTVNGRINDLAHLIPDPPGPDDQPLTAPYEPTESVALGEGAMLGGSRESFNVAIGFSAGGGLEGSRNVVIGAHAGFAVDGLLNNCTAIGQSALSDQVGNMDNVTAIGAQARATGSDQVVLGNWDTNVNVASSPQVRSDTRDMHEAEPCALGLDFLRLLKPVQYRQDFRERYIDWEAKPVPPDPLPEPPRTPTLPKWHPDYQSEAIAYRMNRAAWEEEFTAYQNNLMNYQIELVNWYNSNRHRALEGDGSQAGGRPHYAITGQNLHAAAKQLGRDIGIYQDHQVNGGEQVYSYAPEELVPILVNCINELGAQLASNELIDRLASALITRHSESLASILRPKETSPDADE